MHLSLYSRKYQTHHQKMPKIFVSTHVVAHTRIQFFRLISLSRDVVTHTHILNLARFIDTPIECTTHFFLTHFGRSCCPRHTHRSRAKTQLLNSCLSIRPQVLEVLGACTKNTVHCQLKKKKIVFEKLTHPKIFFDISKNKIAKNGIKTFFTKIPEDFDTQFLFGLNIQFSDCARDSNCAKNNIVLVRRKKQIFFLVICVQKKTKKKSVLLPIIAFRFYLFLL